MRGFLCRFLLGGFTEFSAKGHRSKLKVLKKQIKNFPQLLKVFLLKFINYTYHNISVG